MSGLSIYVFSSNFKARPRWSVAQLSAAKIAIQLQRLPLGYNIATLHKALICFTEHTVIQLKMKLCSAPFCSAQM